MFFRQTKMVCSGRLSKIERTECGWQLFVTQHHWFTRSVRLISILYNTWSCFLLTRNRNWAQRHPTNYLFKWEWQLSICVDVIWIQQSSRSSKRRRTFVTSYRSSKFSISVLTSKMLKRKKLQHQYSFAQTLTNHFYQPLISMPLLLVESFLKAW